MTPIPCSAPAPRPILKRDASSQPLAADLPFTMCDYVLSPHVHFPPTPRMVSLRFTHSPQTYDRAPITVSPNGCLLPPRGERPLRSPPAGYSKRRGRQRGRSRDEYSSSSSSEDEDPTDDIKGSYFHPRAYEACNPEPFVLSTTYRIPSPPSLSPDLSPSEDPGDPVMTPPDPQVSAPVGSVSIVSGAISPGVDPARPASQPSTKSLEHCKGRPHLKRMSTTARRVQYTPNITVDEGCLGGF